jgi:predicted aspartyl protease
MITGVVTASRQAIIRLAVHGPEGQEQEVAAVSDTGFNGTLTLPPALIAALGLAWRRRGRALLADGSESLFDIYEAIVVWDGEPRRIAVDEADIDPLAGIVPTRFAAEAQTSGTGSGGFAPKARIEITIVNFRALNLQ